MTDVDLVYDPKLDRVVVPVHYRVEAGRIDNIAAAEQTNPEKLAEDMIKRGMRATLQSTSIITGSKEIALERIEGAPPATLEKQGDVYIIPSSEVGGFDAITRSAAELLTKLNRIEYDKIGRSIENAAAGLDTTINGAQTQAHAGGAGEGDDRRPGHRQEARHRRRAGAEAPAGDRPAAAGIR